MKKNLRIIVIVSISVCVLIIIGGYIIPIFVIGVSGGCEVGVIKKLQSPNSENSVVVFWRDCGATTSYSANISILAGNERLENKTESFFVADGHNITFDVKWMNDKTIQVKHSKGIKIFKKENVFRGFNIVYD